MDYKKIYDRLVDRAKNRVLEGYSETHHIIPRCIGGSDDPNNICALTPEEHYLAHLLLVKIYPNHSGLVFAAWNMQFHNTDQRMNNKLHGWLKRKHAEAASEKFRQMWSEKREDIRQAMIAERNSPKGQERMHRVIQKRWDEMPKEKRDEFKQKMDQVNKDPNKRKKAGESLKKKWQDPEWREKMSKRKTRGSDGSALKEKWADPVWREKMLEARRKAREKKKNETK